MMRKSIHTREYSILLKLLVESRHNASLTQEELGSALAIEQPAVSKIERGDRRIDLVELKLICDKLGTGLVDFVREFERRIAKRHG